MRLFFGGYAAIKLVLQNTRKADFVEWLEYQPHYLSAESHGWKDERFVIVCVYGEPDETGTLRTQHETIKVLVLPNQIDTTEIEVVCRPTASAPRNFLLAIAQHWPETRAELERRGWIEQPAASDAPLQTRGHYIAFDILLETGFKQFVNWLDRHTRNRTPPGQTVGEDGAEVRILAIEQARLVVSKDEAWARLFWPATISTFSKANKDSDGRLGETKRENVGDVLEVEIRNVPPRVQIIGRGAIPFWGLKDYLSNLETETRRVFDLRNAQPAASGVDISGQVEIARGLRDDLLSRLGMGESAQPAESDAPANPNRAAEERARRIEELRQIMSACKTPNDVPTKEALRQDLGVSMRTLDSYLTEVGMRPHELRRRLEIEQAKAAT